MVIKGLKYLLLGSCLILVVVPVIPALSDMPAVTPVTRYKLPKTVDETSGLAYAEGLWWTVNDSDGEPVLYGVNPESGKLQQRTRVDGVRNVDWEDLAQDEKYLYIADTGNNYAWRKVLSIFVIPHEGLASADSVRPAATLQVSFTDYEEQTRDGRRKHNVDCEAITRVGDHLWLFTKNRGDNQTRLYKAELTSDASKPQQLSPQGEYPVGGLVTAADYNGQTSELALLVYGSGPMFGQASVWRIPVRDGLPDWSHAHQYRLKKPGQWESLLWKGPDRLVVTAEKSLFGVQRLAEIQF
ncbi:MAG: hypothetical protein OIF57_12530 [Marinobacterium sp.]|nr:hypothetical protein [Marinobacterium sp.]